jgi:hypothetical protein
VQGLEHLDGLGPEGAPRGALGGLDGAQDVEGIALSGLDEGLHAVEDRGGGSPIAGREAQEGAVPQPLDRPVQALPVLRDPREATRRA